MIKKASFYIWLIILVTTFFFDTCAMKRKINPNDAPQKGQKETYTLHGRKFHKKCLETLLSESIVCPECAKKLKTIKFFNFQKQSNNVKKSKLKSYAKIVVISTVTIYLLYITCKYYDIFNKDNENSIAYYLNDFYIYVLKHFSKIKKYIRTRKKIKLSIEKFKQSLLSLWKNKSKNKLQKI